MADTPFQLVGDVMGYQKRVQVGRLDLFDLQIDLLPYFGFQALANLFHILALTPD